MGQFPVSERDGTWWIGDICLPPASSGTQLKTMLDERQISRRDLEFGSDEDRAKFEAQFGPG